MKHLNLFEDFEIGTTEFSTFKKDRKPVTFIKEELLILSMNLPEGYIIELKNDLPSDDRVVNSRLLIQCSHFTKDGTIADKKNPFTIWLRKYDDEWYTVQIVSPGRFDPDYYYKCDQFDELVAWIKNMDATISQIFLNMILKSV